MTKWIRNSLLLSVLICSLALISSGCSKKTVMADGAAGGTNGAASSYPEASGGYSEENLPVEGTLDDTSLGGSLDRAAGQSDAYKREHGRSTEGLSPVYFEFDQAIIRSDMVDRLVANADFLRQTPNSYVIVEGNTDERGTNEYNLALGERRAQNTRQYLIDLGIEPGRIRTMSFGEEKPLFTEQNEDAYAQNRRADFVLE